MAVAPLPKVTAWSWSRYSDYTLCPAKFKYKHLMRLPDPGSAAMDRGNQIHKMAEDFVAARGAYVGGPKRAPTVPDEFRFFKEQFLELRAIQGVMVEQAWGFKADWAWIGRPGWFGDDVWLRSKADVFVPYEDNTADLIDHKTGKKYETNKEQVELFAATAFCRIPTLEHVTTRLWYLDVPDKDENEVVMEYTAADAALIMKDWNRRVLPMFNDRKFAPRPNSKCGWCAFSKAKGGPCKF